MFGIRYQNELLDLVPGQDPVIEWVSLAFNDSDELLGSFSYPIDIAATPKVNRLLGYGNQLGMRSSRRDISVLVELFDMPWKQVTLSYVIDEGQYKGSLKIDNGEIATRIRETNLPEVFVETKNGAFVDHKWEFVGANTMGTAAAIQNACSGPGAAPWTMTPFQNRKIFGSYSGEDGSQLYDEPIFINKWLQTFASINENELKTIWYCPQFYLVWTLQKLCEFFGYTAIGEFVDNTFIQSLIIDNNGIYNMEDVYSPDGFKIAPARHLPSLTIAELFKRLRSHFKLIPYFNSDTKTVTFVFADSVLKSPERISLDKYIEKGFRTTGQSVTGVNIIQGIDERDEYYKLIPYVKNYIIGGGNEKEKVESKIGTCFMDTMINELQYPFSNWRIPIKEQTGNAYGERAAGSEADNPEGYGRNEFDLRLLSFRGMQPDGNGDLYPYATSDGLAPDATTELCQSLWLGGSNGILENYHRNWYVFFLRTEPVELKGSLPNKILNRISPIKKVRFQTEEGLHLEALMDKLQFSSDKDKQLIRTNIFLYPVYSQSAIDIAAYQDFNPGDTASPDVVFVKIVVESEHPRYHRHFLGSKQLQAMACDVVLYFYSDLAGTVPVAVNGLPVSIVEHMTGKPGVFSDTPSTVTAYGTRHLVFNQVERYYNWNEKLRVLTWTINNGPRYRVIA